MVGTVEYTNEFGDWWKDLSENQQDDTTVIVELLEESGPNLRFPHTFGIKGSRHKHMRELRIQSGGNPIRIFYAFDPRRNAILLIGGDKTGNNRFYVEYGPVADRLYNDHIEQIRKEDLIK